MAQTEVEKRTRWECPDKVDARILGGPNIVKPLHGVAPRVYMGKTTWDRVRKRTYYLAKYKCEICGANCSTPGTLDCLERGTEVLTVSGWKPIENITLSDSVAQFEPDSETVSFVNPTRVIEKYATELISIGYKSGFNMFLTENHRVLLKNKRTKQWETLLAKDVPVGKWLYSIPTAGKGAGNDRLSLDEKVFIALQADGSLQYRRSTDGMYHFIISVKKARKKKQLAALMHDTTLPHNRLSAKTNQGYLTYSIDVPIDCKKFSNAFEYKMSYGKAIDFLDEISKWDGWKGSRKNAKRVQSDCRCYYSADKDNIDFVQAVAVQAGFGTHLTVSRRKTRKWGELHHSDTPSINLKNEYNLEIKKKAEHGTQTMQKKTVEYGDSVFCLTVPAHYFIVRNKDSDVFITGNCHELYTVDYEKGTSTLAMVVGICKKCHNFFHSGRLITLYKQGGPFYPRSVVLGIVEHGFSLIHDWNEKHPDKPKLKAYSTFLDYLKNPELKEDMEKLIDKYEIELWEEDKKRIAKWEDWKLIFGKKDFPTPYKDYQEWENAMKKASRNDYERNFKDPFSGGVYDDIKALLKENP